MLKHIKPIIKCFSAKNVLICLVQCLFPANPSWFAWNNKNIAGRTGILIINSYITPPFWVCWWFPANYHWNRIFFGSNNIVIVYLVLSQARTAASQWVYIVGFLPAGRVLPYRLICSTYSNQFIKLLQTPWKHGSGERFLSVKCVYHVNTFKQILSFLVLVRKC